MTASETVVGFLHPGQMGASLAEQCRATSRLWIGAGRSTDTAARAENAGLADVASVEAMTGQADVIVSICPPAAAVEVADSVAQAGFDGIYVDANAIAPATTVAIAERFERFVDGGVIGPPAHQTGSTRMYLSGADADVVAELWAGSLLDVRAIGPEAGSASALKLAYSSWTKGSSALLLAARALARAHDVDDDLLAEWAISIPGLAERYDRTVEAVQPKAWRFVGEMHEIADSMATADLPEGFHRAAAEIYERLAAQNAL